MWLNRNGRMCIVQLRDNQFVIFSINSNKKIRFVPRNLYTRRLYYKYSLGYSKPPLDLWSWKQLKKGDQIL